MSTTGAGSSIETAAPPDFTHLAANLRAHRERWRDDPVYFALSTFTRSPAGLGDVTIDPQQARMLEAVAHHDRVAIRSGRGVGKTAAAAIIIHWWLATRFPAVVVTSAGTWNHLEDKLWPETRLWGRQWLLSEAYEYQQMGIYYNLDPDALRAVAASSDKAENVEGYHSPHLLLLIDEAKGMPDEIYAALLASLTTDTGEFGEQKVVALSTPPLSRQGWFAQVSSSSEWEVIHISGIDSPRVSRSYIAEILQHYGEESPEYQSYVLGQIPETTTETVIPLSWFEEAQALAPCSPRKSTRRPVLTCDVAREGDDLSTFGVFDRASFDLVTSEDSQGWLAHADLMKVAGKCLQAVKQYPDAIYFCIDDTGLGGGVTDRLREMQREGKFPSSCHILGVKFGSRPPSRPDRFKQAKDELWWVARESVRQQKIALPSDERIRTWKCPRGSDFKLQMTSALFEYDSTDHIDILDKRVSGREKTKSLPIKSPDLAHAYILGVRYYLRQNNLEVEEKEQADTQEEVLYSRVKQQVKSILKPQTLNPYNRKR